MVRFITSSLLLAFAVLCFASAPSTAELSSVPSSEPTPKNINLSMAPVTPFWAGDHTPVKPPSDGTQVVYENDDGDTTSDGFSNLLGNFGVATTGALLLGLL